MTEIMRLALFGYRINRRAENDKLTPRELLPVYASALPPLQD